MEDGAAEPLDPALSQFADKLIRLIDAARDNLRQRRRPSDLARHVEEHLGRPPQGLPIVNQEVPWYQLVDLQVAIDRWVDGNADRSIDVCGVRSFNGRHSGLSDLLTDDDGSSGAGIGPVEYADVPDSPESSRTCVDFGLYLISDGDDRLAMLLRTVNQGMGRTVSLEVVAEETSTSNRLLSELRRLAVQHSVLRGQVLSLAEGEGPRYGELRFVRRPTLLREELILPDQILDHIEGHVIDVAVERDRLLAAGQHLKRGVLLYGPPGTGKTHTVRYLLSRLATHTAFILSGRALGAVGQACTLARLLQPSLVVLEDVDLIAADRSIGPMGNPLLFEVLNQIDGLGDDVDVTFLLTTNRVDILERALAERPGRVDIAVEIGPPDTEGRLRLFRLYGRSLGLGELSDADFDAASDATEGRTATYVREVVRRAALLAATRSEGPIRVDGETLAEAAQALLADQSALTRSLIGGSSTAGDEEPARGGPRLVQRRMVGRPGRQAPEPFGE